MQVGSNNHIKLRRVLHHLVRNIVNDQMVRLNRRVLCGKLLTNGLKHPFSELQDVCLARGGDLLAPLAKCHLIGEANHLL